MPMPTFEPQQRLIAVLGPFVAASALAAAPGASAGQSVVPMAAHGTAAETASLRQPGWLSKHCPIAVTVDVSAGRTAGHKSGVNLRGVRTEEPLVDGFLEPAVQYTWHLSKTDRFCGIVGTEISYPVSSTSLQPTTATARGGEYIDWSINDPNPSDRFEKFTVYAKAAAGQHRRVRM